MDSSQQQQQPVAAADGSADPSRVWIPEIVARISTFLPRNAVPCILRLVDRATAAQFADRTIHLSEPVPPSLFAARWAPPGATRNLPLELRQRLVALTVGSGAVENMPVALAAAGCAMQPSLLGDAAEGGQVEMCAWLHGNGCPACKMDDELDVLALAAGRGHKQVCEWLLAQRYGWSWDALCAAAGGGHVELLLWLWRQRPGAGAGAAVVAPATDAATAAGGAGDDAGDAAAVAATAAAARSRQEKGSVGSSGTINSSAAASGSATAAAAAATAAAFSELEAAAQAALGGIPVDIQLLQEVAAGCDVATLEAAHAVWHAAEQRAGAERREELRRRHQQRREARREQRRLNVERYRPYLPDPTGVRNPDNASSDEEWEAEEARAVAQAEQLTFEERKQRERVLGAAAASPTPCWRQKVAFLEGAGFAKCAAACEWAAAVEVPDARRHRPSIASAVPPLAPRLLVGTASVAGSSPWAVADTAAGMAAAATASAGSGPEAEVADAAAALLFDLDAHSDDEYEPESEPDVVQPKVNANMSASASYASGSEDDNSLHDGSDAGPEHSHTSPDDALTRVRWLRRRGYPADGAAVIEAAQHGNTDALAFLLKRCGATPRWEAADAAAEGGHVGCLRLLRAARATMGQHTLSRAAQRGRLRVVRWLAERAGLGVLLDADDDSIMSAAAGSGCVPLLAYLRGGQHPPASAGCGGAAGGGSGSGSGSSSSACPLGCGGDGGVCTCRASTASVGVGQEEGGGDQHELDEEGHAGGGRREAQRPAREGRWTCPWDEDTFAWAADGGCEEAMEWMAAHGCPMGVDGLPYVWAGINGDFAALACLRRLGCPWDPQGGTFLRALRSHRRGRWCSVQALQWLLDAGCPVGDWEAALKAVRVRGRDYVEVVAWMEAARKQREAEAGAADDGIDEGGGSGEAGEETSPRTGPGCVPCCVGVR
ncbi:hypothetical protein HYH02_009062 [Chlamydomonas schloesseri]|uniref:Ankyrin repeat domain-containing protein n=1 Tax=Chlamydomonas schloesseri TaxID=2026947 RepID=A0A835WB53_9CHLO|nr:hypothetical protein HYH02_009062 [Chlamydomonas schloesseri]|eukprot:KAG2444121.1 hypothetical protein HYH02_009062 [Chlamydomonas schloesseri]